MASKPEDKTADKTSFFKKKRVKQIAIAAFVVFNILIIYWTASKELSREKTENLEGPTFTWWLLLLAVIAFVGALAADIYKYYILIYHFTKRKDLKLAAQTVFLGRYYDNITPSAVGGQPFQILHMHKHGHVDNEHAAMIPVIAFVSLQTAFVLLCFLTIIFGSSLVLSDVTYAASFIGILLIAFAPGTILFFALKPKVAKRIASVILKFLHAIHIVRNVEKTEEKTLGEIEKYALTVKQFIKNKKLLVKVMSLSFAYQFLLYSIPFLVVSAFGGNVGYLPATMTALTIQAAITFVPTPGNAGAAEGSFYLVFAHLESGNTFWAMLTWRFFTYYAFIALGGLTYLEMAWRKKKHTLSIERSGDSTKQE
ncbi:flippase-like domain-containing protein [Candidatus Saccharibacteria bacterium]|nr:flippase-like domain-containing protein [Candidatus Saccharibacteria bacterium]